MKADLKVVRGDLSIATTCMMSVAWYSWVENSFKGCFGDTGMVAVFSYCVRLAWVRIPLSN